MESVRERGGGGGVVNESTREKKEKKGGRIEHEKPACVKRGKETCNSFRQSRSWDSQGRGERRGDSVFLKS